MLQSKVLVKSLFRKISLYNSKLVRYSYDIWGIHFKDSVSYAYWGEQAANRIYLKTIRNLT